MTDVIDTAAVHLWFSDFREGYLFEVAHVKVSKVGLNAHSIETVGFFSGSFKCHFEISEGERAKLL